MSLRLAQPYPATSTFHLQSHPSCHFNLTFNTNLHFNLKHPTSKPSISTRRTPPTTLPTIRAAAKNLPARDRTIPFGKHKGEMLGTIPSDYLKWVAETCNAEWSSLAEVVLKDPIYRDRIEWELAEKTRIAKGLNSSSSYSDIFAELKNASKRFGWDEEDVEGWCRINYQLLGTSEGGRIPRIADREKRVAAEKEKERLKEEGLRKMKVARARAFVGGERRRERIERRRENPEAERLKEKEREMERLKVEEFNMMRLAMIFLGEERIERVERRSRTVAGGEEKGRLGTGRRYRFGASKLAASTVDDDDEDGDRTDQKVRNPFPGREALFQKILDRKKRK